MTRIEKAIDYRVNLPEKDFELGQWIRIAPLDDDVWESKTGVIVGAVYDNRWRYWVSERTMDGLVILATVLEYDRGRLFNLTQFCPARPNF